MALFFTNNAVTKVDVSEMITNKQEKERIMDRIKILMRNKENVVNVLGKKFKYLIDDWKKDTDTLYTNTNEKDIHVSSTPYTSQKQQTSKFRSVSSNMNLWDEAGWKGCGFIFDTEMKQPAIFGLAFYNINNGTRIVAEWDNLLKENKSGVKIYIIIGIKKEHPHWYRVCIVPDMKDLDPIDDKKRYCTILSRKHTMTPRNSINIDQFIKHYNIFKGCWLMALKIGSDNNIIMPDSFDSAFKFTNIIFRNAWELSTEDEAFIAIEPDDDPFIPIGQERTAPIVESLKLLRQRIKSK